MLTTFLRRLSIPAALVTATLVMSGCASKPDVRADFDKSADFGKYRTYGFVVQTLATGEEFKSLALQAMQTAAAREMESRGYTRSDKPDLLINFKGRLEEKTDIQSTPAPMYGPGWGYGGTEVTTRRYQVGTLVMDMVDREKRQAVFQGGVEGVVTKEMMENKQLAIEKAVAHIFSKFPFVAGQSAPVAPPAGDQKK